MSASSWPGYSAWVSNRQPARDGPIYNIFLFLARDVCCSSFPLSPPFPLRCSCPSTGWIALKLFLAKFPSLLQSEYPRRISLIFHICLLNVAGHGQVHLKRLDPGRAGADVCASPTVQTDGKAGDRWCVLAGYHPDQVADYLVRPSGSRTVVTRNLKFIICRPSIKIPSCTESNPHLTIAQDAFSGAFSRAFPEKIRNAVEIEGKCVVQFLQREGAFAESFGRVRTTYSDEWVKQRCADHVRWDSRSVIG